MKRLLVIFLLLSLTLVAFGGGQSGKETTEGPAPTAAVERTGKYGEAPQLAAMVKAGSLPPVEERLPENPLVVPVVDGIGKYGGTWRLVECAQAIGLERRQHGDEEAAAKEL